MAQKIYTTFEVSRFCSVDISTVMGWVDDGKLQAYRTPGGHRRIHHAALIEFLERYQMPIHPLLKKIHKRVLIVDDDAATVRILRRLIEKMDSSLEIVVAFDGFDAGRQLETFFPDLILLDLMLPGIDGFQVCRNIRADDRKKDVKIVAISAITTEGIEKKIIEHGANQFVHKPFDINTLRDVISSLLELDDDERTIDKIDRRTAEHV